MGVGGEALTVVATPFSFLWSSLMKKSPMESSRLSRGGLVFAIAIVLVMVSCGRPLPEDGRDDYLSSLKSCGSSKARDIYALKNIPPKFGVTGCPVYNSIVLEGCAAVPCLIEMVSNTVEVDKAVFGFPTWVGTTVTVGDVALFLVVMITGASMSVLTSDNNDINLFLWLASDGNRLAVQYQIREWFIAGKYRERCRGVTNLVRSLLSGYEYRGNLDSYPSVGGTLLAPPSGRVSWPPPEG